MSSYSFLIMVEFIPETVGKIFCWKYRCIPEIINAHVCELFPKICSWSQKLIITHTELNGIVSTMPY